MSEDGKVFGRAKVLDTPAGRVAATLLREGSLGVSSRALGNIDDKGIVRDFTLLGYDLVQEPSTNQFVDTMTESKSYIIRDGLIYEETDTSDVAKNDTGEKSSKAKIREDEESSPYDNLISVLALLKDLLPSPTHSKLMDAIKDPSTRPEKKREMLQMVIDELGQGEKVADEMPKWVKMFNHDTISVTKSVITGQKKLNNEDTEAHMQYICHGCGEKMLSKNGKKPDSCSQCGGTDIKEMKITGENVEPKSIFDQMMQCWISEYRRKYL